ncbi:glycosyltransferase [Fontibacter flavus]|uniref:Glycosyltransferase n=1 Tax=Fontibacter flavus TaxID=654838 RepID=A0ABV6FUE4_9BACT
MKILRVVSELDFGGVEQVLANSLPRLVKMKGLKVSVVVLGKGGRISRSMEAQGIQIEILNHNPRIPNLKSIYRLIKIIRRLKPDVLHCQGGEANFHGLIAARLADVPVRIGEEIGFPNHHSYWKYIFKLVYKNATKVISISQAVKERIVELGEVEAEKVEVVYNPVEIKGKSIDFSLRASTPRHGGQENDKGKAILFSEPDLHGNQIEGEKPFVFVTTCRLVPVKNLDRLINALARLCNEFSEKSIELWIVGDGPLRETLENQSKELGVSDKVKFWGFQENVFLFLKKADVFVLPSLSEGSSVSLVEAMLSGLPSIVTKVGGAIEILGSSKSGVYIDPLNIESIVSAMVDLISLPLQERDGMGKSAITEARRFLPENYEKLLINIYNG